MLQVCIIIKTNRWDFCNYEFQYFRSEPPRLFSSGVDSHYFFAAKQLSKKSVFGQATLIYLN